MRRSSVSFKIPPVFRNFRHHFRITPKELRHVTTQLNPLLTTKVQKEKKRKILLATLKFTLDSLDCFARQCVRNENKKKKNHGNDGDVGMYVCTCSIVFWV